MKHVIFIGLKLGYIPYKYFFPFVYLRNVNILTKFVHSTENLKQIMNIWFKFY